MGLAQSAELSPWALLLGLALLFAGGAWLWTLAVRKGLPGVPRRLERLPSAGLFGAGSAPLSQGLQAWEVDPGHAAALLGPLLATLARDHRVLLAAPERSPIPRWPEALSTGPSTPAPATWASWLPDWPTRPVCQSWS